ncbi:sensor histidine kinase [Nannocystis pusilla]|uniref:histidine kinase n=1 Tax=Nannocystis pusilla TaxID=889268 RepID=A0ABS7TV14_9BACT|nr:HAMP domain-containing sensor histidine kinase [Nannocystis pusilla]MBZ5712093.1 HAMP domain-containing histidine kinase [Nannocystis pusilla]
MSLRRRLLVFGALLPAALLALALFLIGLVLDHLLLESVDRGLTLQAASESVSLFDRPGQDAHLHFGDSALVADLQRLHHQGALYGPDGARLLAYPADTVAPERLTAADVTRAPALQTRAIAPGERIRELALAIDSPRGEPHAIWLAVSLASNDAALAAYARAAGLIGAAVTALMLLLQIAHARGLVQRVQSLHAHMQRLQDGDFSTLPPVDRGTDVIASLRDAIADATDKLRTASELQHRLVADAAHELRTPLTAMRMEIDVTLRRERSPEQLVDALTRVRTEVDRLGELASKLLAMATLRRAEWERVPIEAVAAVRAALDSHRAVAEPRAIALQLHAPELAPIRANPGPLRQAVDNLLANAIKFAPPGTAVDVTIRDGDNQLEILVEDRGPGVPPEHQETIFAPFRRLHRGIDGAGLGLAIVREVAEAHGGHAWVTPRPGGGACFHLVIARA